MIRTLKNILRSLNNCKGNLSLENISTAVVITVIFGSVVATSSRTVVFDSEEKAHVFNAQTIATAVETHISEDSIGPELGANLTITLDDLYTADKVGLATDPSGTTYDSVETEILVQNVEENGRSVNKIFVKLVGTGGYVYTDETDVLVAIDSRVESSKLKRDDVLVPGRDTDGH